MDYGEVDQNDHSEVSDKAAGGQDTSLPGLLFYDQIVSISSSSSSSVGDDKSSDRTAGNRLKLAPVLRVSASGLLPLLVPPRGSAEALQRRGEWAAQADSWGWLLPGSDSDSLNTEEGMTFDA